MSRLKYGPISPYATEKARPVRITAGETFRAKSGRFVTLNAGLVEVADDGDALLYGWAEVADSGSGTTATGAMANVIPAMACSEIFRIPVLAGTFVEAMIGKTCDLVRATTGGVTLIQGAKLDASGEDNLMIVGGDAVNNEYVDVMFNQSKVVPANGVV